MQSAIKRPSLPATKPDPTPFDRVPMNLKKCLFDHVFEPPLRAFEPIWPMPLQPNRLTLEDESLNAAVSCVRMYLELGQDVEWFHVMVRTIAFPSFLQAMDNDAGQTRTLPFSCWCDGGEPIEARLRQHRHMIVVSYPKGHFERNVWNKIVPEDRPRKNFRCIYSKPIESAMHLVDTIGYVCKRESRCTFSGENKKLPEKQNHFYLFQSLPKDYRLPLVLQWDGGLIELLNLEFKNMKRRALVEAMMDFVERKFRFKIQNIPGITLGTVLPVSKEFQPCKRPTHYALHLIGGRKMYFERNYDLCHLTPEAWLKKQADMNNLFYYVVGEEHWTPRPHHQGLINEFKPLVDRNRELEAENARHKRKHESLEEENSELKKRNESLEMENKSLLKKIIKLDEKIHRMNEEENTRLKKKTNQLIQQLSKVKMEFAKVKKELAETKQELAETKKENDELKVELGRFKRPRTFESATKNNK